jgi:DnaJ-class molecular chaperone
VSKYICKDCGGVVRGPHVLFYKTTCFNCGKFTYCCDKDMYIYFEPETFRICSNCNGSGDIKRYKLVYDTCNVCKGTGYL